MAAASSNPLSSTAQEQNSSRSSQSRRSMTATHGGLSPSDSYPPPLSLSEMVDQDQFVSSSSATSSDSSSPKEAHAAVVATCYLVDDGSAGADAQVDITENGGAAKRPDWNKPSNGATAGGGTVMGAASWPALSDSARSSPKSSSTYSVKASPHGSVTASQEMALASLFSPKKPHTGISTPPTIHGPPAHQKLMKYGDSSSSHHSMLANGSLSQALPSPGAFVDTLPSIPGKSGGSGGESSRDAGEKGGTNGGNELHQHRDSFRKNNSGQLQRGDGSYHHNSGRRDQDRGKQDWGAPHRNFGGRQSHAPHQRVGSRPFLRAPAPNAPFIPPPPSVAILPPFVGTPLVYTEMPSHLYYVPGPHPESIRSMQQVHLPIHDTNLASKIVNQIDYYFSNENLVKDTFLRQNMDNKGWVSLNLIAGFKKSQSADALMKALGTQQLRSLLQDGCSLSPRTS